MTISRVDVGRTRQDQVLLDESLFKQTITQERKRANRSGFGMALVLIDLSNKSEQETIDGAMVVNALLAATSEPDFLGWFEPPCVLGLIVPELDPADLVTAGDRLACTVRSAIAHHGGEALAQQISIRVRVYPQTTTSSEQPVSPMDPLLYPELSTNELTSSKFRIFKRGMDMVLSAILLILLSPLFALIAALVKLSSPGPVIFKQIRIGYLMKPFTMYKFRTMYVTADHQVHQDYVSWFITASDQAGPQQKPTLFKLTNDTRITPIGRFLRKTSLDELPQLWNVLIGAMSLVGPRPPLPYELHQYKPWHCARVLEAKPGVTGLWQVVGRSRTTFDEMVRLDLRYARTMSLRSDIKILLATPAAMITGKGAC
jgi:lipopolysaccharide/colanic/teichoic acid biosynthesis glycosyltransferase